MEQTPASPFEREQMKTSSGEIVTYREKQWQGFRTELVRRIGLARQEIEVSGNAHAIFLNLEGAARSGENFIDGRRSSFVVRPEGSLTYVPAGGSWSGWDEGDSRAAYLLLTVDRAFAGNFFDDPNKVDRLRPELGFHDLAAQFAARKIAAELFHLDQASELIVEGQLTTIFGHLARRANQRRRSVKGGLAPNTLRRVVERLSDISDEPVSLTSLCQELGMSLPHFSRAFKQSTGVTPHAYFNQRRLEHASMLLRTTSSPVTEIALICGFASASHLSTTFTQALGVSPSVYRSVWGRAGK
jgi:AraC-like DNA-binding protein